MPIVELLVWTLDRANPIFEEKKPSSKILMVLEELERMKRKSEVSE